MSIAPVWAECKALLEAAALPGLHLRWPNDQFGKPLAESTWLLTEVAGSLSRPIELGGGVWESDGQLMLHVFVPVGGGIEAGLALRDELIGILRDKEPSPLIFRSFTFDPGGQGEDDGLWFRLSAYGSWIYQEIRQP